MAQCDKLRGHEFFSHDLYFDEECYSKKKKKKKNVGHISRGSIENRVIRISATSVI